MHPSSILRPTHPVNTRQTELVPGSVRRALGEDPLCAWKVGDMRDSLAD